MIHTTDTPIADATMMTEWRFEGLTLAAHAEFVVLPSLCHGGYGRGRDGARVRQGGLDVTGQCQTGQDRVRHGQGGWNSRGGGQQCQGKNGIRNEYPNKQGHDGSGGVRAIEPNAVFVRCSNGAAPGQVIECVQVGMMVVVVIMSSSSSSSRVGVGIRRGSTAQIMAGSTEKCPSIENFSR